MIAVLPGLSGADAPCVVLDVDITRDVPDQRLDREDGAAYRVAWVLVRRGKTPVAGVALRCEDGFLDGAELRATLLESTGGAESKRHVANPAMTALGSIGEVAAGIEGPPPGVTVVVCTRDRPEALARCLASLVVQDYGRYQVMVVDNAPTTDGARQVVAGFESQLAVRYVKEPLPGLSRARNRAVSESTTEVLAWLDDDEVADPWWVTQLASEFSRDPTVGAVCGSMPPAVLESPAQIWFELWNGDMKGLAFRRHVFSLETMDRRDAVYPLPPFGSGGNMALRRKLISDLGGFDEALGAGSPAMAVEDTLAFSEILLSGSKLVYQPSAVIHHSTRYHVDDLRKQLYGYGAGISAFYTALLCNHPTVVRDVVALLPRAAQFLKSPESVRDRQLGPDFPSDLLDANKRGMAAGGYLYLKGRFALRGAGRRHRLRPEV
jgi:glycosyltransferase involved in cell wall biosynthesis